MFRRLARERLLTHPLRCSRPPRWRRVRRQGSARAG
jgi:hypothetical protein